MAEEIKYSSSAKITQQRRLKVQLSLPTVPRPENLLALLSSTEQGSGNSVASRTWAVTVPLYSALGSVLGPSLQGH